MFLNHFNGDEELELREFIDKIDTKDELVIDYSRSNGYMPELSLRNGGFLALATVLLLECNVIRLKRASMNKVADKKKIEKPRFCSVVKETFSGQARYVKKRLGFRSKKKVATAE